MTIEWIGLGYIALGVVVAAAASLVARPISAADRILLVVLWPITAPLLLAGGVTDRKTADDEDALAAALAGAAGSPLASVLPDAATAAALQRGLREATARLADLELVLARPDFDPVAVEDQVRALRARGATGAAATARLRIHTLGQLGHLRARYRTELDEIRELIAQLVTQAELVRLQPAATGATRELVAELVTRVEGLGELFADQAALDDDGGPGARPGLAEPAS